MTEFTLAPKQLLYPSRPRLDFRYENLAPPTEEMWDAMQEAAGHLGIASQHEDPTVAELEGYVAEITGKEEALFLPTTTTANNLALQALDLWGKQIVLEARCHMYWVERFHFATYAGAVPVLVDGDKFGAISPEELDRVFNRSYYNLRLETGLICLENTHNVCGGTFLSARYTRTVAKIAHSYGAQLFVDGARIFNAAVGQQVPLRKLTEPADVIAITLSKGLLAPMGAMLCGSSHLLSRVRALGKRTGSMNIHKAGIPAAAALVALRRMPQRLEDDHRRARRLAEALRAIDGISIDLETVQTNLVRVDTRRTGLSAWELADRLKSYEVGVHILEPTAFKMTTYSTISDEDVDEVVEIFKGILSTR